MNGVDTINAVKDAAKYIGPYRFVIDGTMIVLMAITLWNISAWKTKSDISQETSKAERMAITTRLSVLEGSVPVISNLPITKDADKRLTVLEETLPLKLESIDTRLGGIEKSVERLENRK